LEHNMRKAMLLGVLFLVSGAVGASEGFDDLAKLAKSGVGDEVMLAYIDASTVAYDLTVDEILFFNDLGVSQKVITAAVKHGKELRDTGAAPAPVVEPARPTPVVEAQDPVIGRPDTDAGDVEAPPPPQRVVAQAQPAVVYQEPASVVAPAAEDLNISYFYESLSPYGHWIDVDGTYVWQPTVSTVNTEWRPYCHGGHWVYTDCGWAWHSEYSWGWAPFHYGRWHHHDRHGWVWTPDTVWGPAWVAWRNSDSHCGWAPLPPAARYEAGVGFHFGGKHVSVDFNFGLGERDYTFVPVERVCEPTIVTYVVPRARVTTIYERTTIIENTYVVRENRIVNSGISVDIVAHASHRDIRPVVIVDASYQAGQPLGRNTVRNNEFVAYRPQIAAATPVTPALAETRRQERVQRAIIRQQAETDRTAIRQDNKTQRTEARQDARTTETQARQENTAERVQARQEAATVAAQQRAQQAEARKQAEAAQTAENERKRLEKAADREDDQKRQAELRAAAAEQRAKAAEAKKAQREAEDRAEAQQKAAEATQREQERVAKRQQEDTAEAQRKAQRDAEKNTDAQRRAAAEAAREQARKDAAARDDAADAQRKAQRDAAETAREQARKDAAAREAAERDAREQARKDKEAARNQPQQKDSDMGARNGGMTTRDNPPPQQPANDAREARKEREDKAKAERDAREAQAKAEREADKKARDAARDAREAARDAKDPKKKKDKDKDPNDPNN
jgi:hypothetical protein